MTAKKRLLPILMAILMVFSMMPMTAGTVFASENENPGLEFGTGVLETGANTDNAQTVFYGANEGNPIAWRVIKYKDTGNEYTTYPDGQNNSMTLFAAKNLKSNVPFNPFNPSTRNNDYEGSNLKSVVDGLYGSLFSTQEQSAIESRTLDVNEYNEQEPYSTGVSGTSTSGYLWPLSTAEAVALPSPAFRDSRDHWWLRSPGLDMCDAAIVNNGGGVYREGLDVQNGRCVRPAFNLNLSSVLFISAALGGKSSGAVGANALSAIPDNNSNEWKMTLHDSVRDGFDAAPAAGAVLSQDKYYTSWSIPIVYSGASASNDNDYVSVILADSSNKALYYGNIANKTSASSDAGQEVTIPLGLTAGNYKLYVFSEQINGGKLSDYASEFKTIDLTVNAPPVKTVTFKARGGTWQDETTADKQVPVEIGQAVTAPPDPTRVGANFKGWYDESMTSRYSFDTPVNQDITLYARWTAVYGFNSYNAATKTESSGGKFSVSESHFENDPTYGWTFMTMDTETQRTLKAFPDDGYKFSGWYEGKVEDIYKDGKLYSQTILPKDLDDPSTLLSTDSEYPVTITQSGSICAVFECAGHQWEQKVAKATPDADGRVYQQCSVCGTERNSVPLGKVGNISLSGTDFTYTGKAIEPKVTVANADETLSADSYTVEYSNNVNAGTATAKVTLKGDHYEGSKDLTFRIKAKAIKPTLSISAGSCKYDGKVKTPAVTVKDGTAVLKASDYTVFYASGRINAGTYKVTVKLKGNYAGNASGTFKIVKAANPLKLKGRKVKVKLAKLANKNQKLIATKAIEFKKKGKGQKTYTLISAQNGTKNYKKFFRISKKTGKITIRKGLKAGTYEVKVKVKAKGNKNYMSAAKTATITIKVK